MTDPFSNLDPAKQQKIINASLQEFAEHGFEQASTNRIVKEAGIGKGMLFYYFNSKQELFYYLVEYGMEYIIQNYLSKIDEQEADFIERYRKTAQIKMEAHSENPHIFHFMGSLFLDQGLKLPKKLEAKLIELRRIGNEKLYDHFDHSLFREDIEIEKIFKMIHWIMDGYEKEIISQLQGKKLANIDFAPLWEEFDQYLDALKKSFYK